ncbi:hypothetical protein KGP65_14315 [Burkholderia multivorans]|uniref:hypothetical protein n=1 Tax=Burkholderia multivorans TaxID=87883 RepID=UPI0012D8E51C|nr:hypothetical protein [Burkholderia multivorans]MBU9203444.1 hypothetical protein [Burkholderia multivorans]MCA8386480.1 hypothetical protein [Burkholderia multivorans]MCO8318382.1 hypothetical protein [Burkholderia multivorans]MCO8351357.1 hypothetical protein [Burkholderia multivorans]MCO8384863.1 hypothetical protein [Burkholderia multivorans]
MTLGQMIPNRLYVTHNGVRLDAEEPKRLPNDREYRVVRGNGARTDAQRHVGIAPRP